MTERRSAIFPTGPPEVVLYALGLAIALFALSQPVLSPKGVLLFPEVVVPLALSVVPFAAGWRVRTVDRPYQVTANVLRVVTILTTFALFTTGVVFASQWLAGAVVLDLLFPVVLTVAMGVATGTLTGFYYDELVVKRREVEAENERARSLNQRLQVINRVLRHNVRTELTIISGHLSKLLDQFDGDDDAVADSSAECEAALSRLETLVEKTRRANKLAVNETVNQDVVPMIRRHLDSLEQRHPDVDFELDLPATASVRAHPLVETAIVEALDNAVRHNDTTDLVVRIAVDRRELESGPLVDVAVSDTGTGIPHHELGALEAGTESPLQHTSGIGLWFLKWVADESGGDLAFAENDPSGTVVRLTLPAAQDEGLSSETVEQVIDLLNERRSTDGDVDGEQSVLTDR